MAVLDVAFFATVSGEAVASTPAATAGTSCTRPRRPTPGRWWRSRWPARCGWPTARRWTTRSWARTWTASSRTASAAAWRYKAYVHQDVVILNRNLVHDVLRLFRRRTLALVGAAGCRYLPESYVWWDGSGVLGRVVEYDDGTERLLDLEQPEGEYELVEAVDGLCLITQHDLPWDEAIEGFHFYDVAQSTRYVLAGYELAVPRQDEPWFGHDFKPWDEERTAEFYAARDAFRRRRELTRKRNPRP